MRFNFRFDKTLQAAGMLLHMSGGSMPRLKLLKLLYIADRQCLAAEGNTITGDKAYAMRKGPVISTTYSIIRGEDSQSCRWQRFLKSNKNGIVYSVTDPGTEDLYQFEKEIIKQVHKQYGDTSVEAIVEITHAFPEWKKYEERLRNPEEKKSYPISIQEILEGLQKPEMLKQVRQNIADEHFHHELFQNQ